MSYTQGFCLEGPLCKWTNIMQGWQYRTFVLDSTAGQLSYYMSKAKQEKGAARGVISLKNAMIGIDDEDECTFTITSGAKTYHFQAKDLEDRQKWTTALENAIMFHSSRFSRHLTPVNLADPLGDFETSLAEADRYLQMMIDAIGTLKQRMPKTSEPNDVECGRCKEVLDSAQAVTETVGRSIVLLQIAKSTIYEQPDIGRPLVLDTAAAAAAVSAAGELSSAEQRASASDDDHDEQFFDADDDATAEPLAASDGSDQLHDAPERAVEALPSSRSASPSDALHSANPHPQPPSPTSPPSPPHDEYYDELYDEADAEDLGDINKHGSIIHHLLSQVRIGMDLTKIILPTFILERRSFLEFLSDFFAHADLFANLAKPKTPRERFMEVVRFYMSTFHAGRRSEIAKKPYNPIIGEMFRCFWELNQPDSAAAGAAAPTGGPVAWATPRDVTFIAEQVSHHPPLSAFYAECEDARVSFNGYIWIKSKFLGLSIAAHMVGQGVITLLDHNENYIVTFPSGYARSILSVPWIELGGTCQIKCQETGYSAVVEFLTKPFYGGEKNRISAKLTDAGGKVFCTLNGHWNKQVFAKFDQPNGGAQQELFFDAVNTSTVRKRCKPVTQQTANESRRLWREVTLNLKLKNIAEATKHKAHLEHVQREGEKQRKLEARKFDTRHFVESGEHWIYVNPLVRRLAPAKNANLPLA